MPEDHRSEPRRLPGPPPAAGLYDPRHEHDACGVGFVVDIKGRKSHKIVRQSLQVLMNLAHRGACGCEVNTGDGAGVLLQVPDKFLRKVAPAPLPPAGEYGVGPCDGLDLLMIDNRGVKVWADGMAETLRNFDGKPGYTLAQGQ